MQSIFGINRERNENNKKKTSSIGNFIRKHKLISLTVSIFTMCLIINIALIYNFMIILENI